MADLKCPVTGKTRTAISGGGTLNRDWWPNQLNAVYFGRLRRNTVIRFLGRI